MKIVFMGTPQIAATILDSMILHKNEIIAVITQPDRPKGRGGEMSCSEVKKLALTHKIPVYQPERVKNPEFLARLSELKPDVIVVAAFGQLLPTSILTLPPYGCINIHASLLPKYRGAAPIQWAVIHGEEKTGVTIMQMDAGIDTGDILLQEEVILAKDETAGSLHDKIAVAGGIAIQEALNQIKAGTIKSRSQDNDQSSYAKMLDKAMGDIDFSKSAQEIERLIRGLTPWPSAYTHYHNKILKLWKACALEKEETLDSQGVPGEVIRVDADSISIQTGDGLLLVQEVQLEGKKRMSVAEFLRGYHVLAGETFVKEVRKE